MDVWMDGKIPSHDILTWADYLFLFTSFSGFLELVKIQKGISYGLRASGDELSNKGICMDVWMDV